MEFVERMSGYGNDGIRNDNGADRDVKIFKFRELGNGIDQKYQTQHH